MLFTTIARDYLRWHYGSAFHELFHVWLNFLWFIIHFFSIPQLSRSLFLPWKRITEERRGYSFENIASFVIINLLSRVIGGLVRGTVVLLGLAVLMATIITGLLVCLLWFGAPILVVTLIGFGVSLIISNTLI